MNVVNKLVQDFKGKIIINSAPGQGTTFILCFPQALAIISAILVTMEEEIYAFPLSEVIETIRVSREQITTLEGHEIINLRGEVLPVYVLSDIIGLKNKKEATEVPIVIVNYNSRKLGFIVDDLVGKQEIVIKSLDKNFRNVKGLTGASMLGDGTIILVLDIPGVVELASEKGALYDNELASIEMNRITPSRSLEATDSELITKTVSPTNIFNNTLLQAMLADKSRSKRKKDRTETRRDSMSSNDNISIARPIPREPEREKEEQVPKNIETILPKPAVEKQKPQPEEPKIVAVESVEASVEREIIKDFRAQTKERFSTVLPGDRKIDDLLSKEQIKKFESVVNTGMMNAGLVLSQLLGSNVELFIPEISLTDKEALTKEIRNSDVGFFGLKIRIRGSLNGNLLMMFGETQARKLVDDLLKSNENRKEPKKISEDLRSVLSEISNIVCASVINAISNKSKSEILPDVPEFIAGSFKDVLDIVKPEKTKFLSMHTEFVHEADNLLGNLLFLPDFDELTVIISMM
ncbi:MAG: chemotaxis protein CheW [Leptospira sp.]|nr:chemotaxis protein CheW [Leptospira sp.]